MNILTFDIEEWFLEQKLYGGRPQRFKQIDDVFARVLEALDARGIKGTFFCIGRMATDYTQVVRLIADHGHEVGCHSHEHTWLNKMDTHRLREDTMTAIKALEDVAGQQVVSYRAPAFSITHENPWAVEVLAACGIKNDASIFPTSRAYGGYQHFPQDRPCTIGYHGATLREFPISLATVFGKRIAYSGGGYFRLLPYWFVSRMLDRSNYNICYFHLVDLVSGKIKLKSRKEYEDYFHEPGTLKNRLVRFAKANATMGDSYHKLVKLLSTHSFVSMAEAVRQTDWSKTSTIEL
jgi:polysaccharide deacetylase family protein (PEP-CTERM system associated)